jgi:hypothetical protein
MVIKHTQHTQQMRVRVEGDRWAAQRAEGGAWVWPGVIRASESVGRVNAGSVMLLFVQGGARMESFGLIGCTERVLLLLCAGHPRW